MLTVILVALAASGWLAAIVLGGLYLDTRRDSRVLGGVRQLRRGPFASRYPARWADVDADSDPRNPGRWEP